MIQNPSVLLNKKLICRITCSTLLLLTFLTSGVAAQQHDSEAECGKLKAYLESTRIKAHQQCLDGCAKGDPKGRECSCHTCQHLHGLSPHIEEQVNECLVKVRLSNASKYNLSPKSFQQIEELKEDMRLAGILNKVLEIAPFAIAFSNTNANGMAFSLSQTDWNLWTNVVSQMPEFYKNQLAHKCQLNWTMHVTARRHNDAEFWRTMTESF